MRSYLIATPTLPTTQRRPRARGSHAIGAIGSRARLPRGYGGRSHWPCDLSAGNGKGASLTSKPKAHLSDAQVERASPDARIHLARVTHAIARRLLADVRSADGDGFMNT